MAIRNAGKSIREARENMGLSQEKFSEGICSAYSLSRIENGTSGVSPSTFQALMARAGIHCETSPIFANRTDFDCFYALKHARFYLDAWQLQSAYDELEKAEQLQWAKNKFYYQESLMLHNKLQFRSGCTDHEQCLISLLDALSITRDNFDILDFRSCLLSTVEIELLTLIAQEYLYTAQLSSCLSICNQLYTHIKNMQLSYSEKNRLLAEESVVYVKYLIATEDYSSAHLIADTNRHTMVLDVQDAPLLELSFLTGLASYYLGNKEACFHAFKNTFYAAHAIESCYSTTCYQYTKRLNASFITNDIEGLAKITLTPFMQKKTIDTSDFSEGIYDPFSDDLFTIGKLIQVFRTEQKLSQITLCQGLCSKSKLSKIENGSLQPDIFLTEALLQRLGISERIFSFWGNKLESQIYNLRFKLIHAQNLSKDQLNLLLLSFEKLIPKDNPLLLQFSLLAKITIIDSSEEELHTLKTALDITLPQFEISEISNYRLSWVELNIIYRMSTCLTNSFTPSKSLTFFNKLLEYEESSQPDLIIQSTCFNLILYFFCLSLYKQKHFFAIINFLPNLAFSVLRFSLKVLGYFLFYYSQTLGECSKYEDAKIYGYYSISIQSIYELTPNSDCLKQYLKDDFNIILI